jgi:tetratricopeptide (TPR) repeat protein
MSLLSNADQLAKKRKIIIISSSLVGAVILGIIGFLAYNVPKSTNMDFTSIRKNISGGITAKSHVDADMRSIFASDYEVSEAERQFSEERSLFVKESRGREYTEQALMDYYRGDFKEAFRRVDRAISYDPSNYVATRLRAQLNLELRKYNRAYMDLERALQIPNEDSTLERDINVLKRLIRYTRIEIENLQRYVHGHPEDTLASARLEELYDQMK